MSTISRRRRRLNHVRTPNACSGLHLLAH